MRERFLHEFDALWFDCMNGDSRETGKLTPDGCGIRVLQYTGPVVPVAQKRCATAQQKRIGGAQPFGVIGIEAFVRGVGLPAIVEQDHDIFTRPLVIAIQGHDVANN